MVGAMHYLDSVAKRFPFGGGGAIEPTTLATYKSMLPYADGYTEQQRSNLIAGADRILGAIEKATTKSGDAAVAKSAWSYADLEAVGLLRTIAGISVVLDRPCGTKQCGTGANGEQWERTYTCDYGFIPGTTSPDGEEFDVYVGTCPESPTAYLITQYKQDGTYDEPKLMLAFGSVDDAITTFLAHMPLWALGDVSAMPVSVLANLLNVDVSVAMSAVQKAMCAGKKSVFKWNKANTATAKAAEFRKIPIVIKAERVIEPQVIHTLEGDMRAQPGDWIVTGILGERYPCDGEAFKLTFVPVNDDACNAWREQYGSPWAPLPEQREPEGPTSSQSPTMMAVAERYKDIDFTPPDGVREAARRGLELHKDGMTGDGLEPATVAWSNRIANGEAVSPEKARQGYAFFARNQRFKDAPKDSPAWASWMLWFGDAGAAWFNKLVEQMDARDRDAGIAKAEWSTADVNDLVDDAFLYIAPGGEKDADGKTVPRSLRYFPVYNASSEVDLPHLRNALSRIGQADIPQAAKDAARDKAEQLLKQVTVDAKANADVVAKSIVRDNRKSADVLSMDQLRTLAEHQIRKLLYPNATEETPLYQLDLWVSDVYDNNVVYSTKGELYRIGYSVDSATATLVLVGEPERVLRTYASIVPTTMANITPAVAGPAIEPPSQVGADGQPINPPTQNAQPANAANAKELPTPVPVDVVAIDVGATILVRAGELFNTWDDVTNVLRASGRNNDDVAEIIKSLRLPLDERKRALATTAAFTSVMRWEGTPQPFRKADSTEHPVVSAPLECMFASPEEMGGWIGWIEDKHQKWFALVDATGTARVWLAREANGSVCGPAYELKRKDIAAQQLDTVNAKSDERFDKLNEYLKTNPPTFARNGDGSIFTAKANDNAPKGKRLVYAVVLEPHPGDGSGDAQRHTYDEEFCEEACHYFARFQILKDNHGTAGVILPRDRIYVAQNYCAPCEMMLGSQKVKQGSWIMAVCIPDDELWAKVERGEWNAFSIEGHSTHTQIAA